MAETQSFPKFLPKETRFLTGENPSPTKMSGTFSQLETAFSMLESFLGNGTDYHVTPPEIGSTDNRKMLFNVSSAIGRTDKLYKPINQLPSLKFIADNWGGNATSYSSDTTTLSFVTNILYVAIPANARVGHEFGIYYTGKGRVFGLDGTTNWVNLPTLPNGTYGWYTILITANISFFRISLQGSGATDFHVKSLYVVDKSTLNGAYNKAYCLPLENTVYWAAKTPCKFANPNTNNTQQCLTKTCDYCIGQTYEMDQSNPNYGQPKCTTYNVTTNPTGAHWDNFGTNQPISYTAEANTGLTSRGSILTLQAPLLTVYKQYGIMLKSYHMHQELLDTMIPSNQCVIYDTKNSSATIKYLTNLYSAGGKNGNIRSDIFYVKDTDEISNGATDPRRFMVIGGDYGLLDLIYDMIQFINLPVPVDATDHIAIYSV
jgi:hypothetical protein